MNMREYTQLKPPRLASIQPLPTLEPKGLSTSTDLEAAQQMKIGATCVYFYCLILMSVITQ